MIFLQLKTTGVFTARQLKNQIMKYWIFSLLVFVSVSSFAQADAAQDSIPFEIRKQAYLYSMANKYNDPSVARMALYNLLVADPTNTAILDSLAISYFDYQQYASAALVAQDAIAINPKDLFATEIAAIAFENLGVKSRSITYYEKLYLANNSLSTLYKICFLQLDEKRYNEGLNNADVIINSSKSETLKLVFPVNQKETQEVSMKVAAIRFKGMLEEDRGNTSMALEYYQKAIEMEPEFVILKEQIKTLKGE
ncbi:MAG: tetratricopeptide (TPR) repeat protein [Marinoscillum sp.]